MWHILDMTPEHIRKCMISHIPRSVSGLIRMWKIRYESDMCICIRHVSGQIGYSPINESRTSLKKYHWGEWCLRWTLFWVSMQCCLVCGFPAELRYFYTVAMDCFLVCSVKWHPPSPRPPAFSMQDPHRREKLQKYPIGLVLNSNWASFVSQTWKPVSTSTLGCFAIVYMQISSEKSDTVYKSELGFKTFVMGNSL